MKQRQIEALMAEAYIVGEFCSATITALIAPALARLPTQCVGNCRGACSHFHKRSGKVIIPLTVGEILEETIAQKVA